MRSIFCFKKVFFCQPFFEKIQTLCRVPPFKKVFFCQPFFVSFPLFHPFSKKRKVFQPFPKVFQGKPTFPELFLTKMVFLKRYKVFRRKTCVVALPSKTLGRDTRLENLCTFLFTPFLRKGVKRKVFRRKTYKRGEKG
jgi:hypothetical protein